MNVAKRGPTVFVVVGNLVEVRFKVLSGSFCSTVRIRIPLIARWRGRTSYNS